MLSIAKCTIEVYRYIAHTYSYPTNPSGICDMHEHTYVMACITSVLDKQVPESAVPLSVLMASTTIETPKYLVVDDGKEPACMLALWDALDVVDALGWQVVEYNEDL